MCVVSTKRGSHEVNVIMMQSDRNDPCLSDLKSCSFLT